VAVFALALWLGPGGAQAQEEGAAANGTTPPPPATVFLPVVLLGPGTPPRTVDAVPVAGPPTDRPAATNPDLNLAVRGYVATEAELHLIEVGGPTDDDPPQLANLFSAPRVPTFTAAYQVYDWDWGCGADGCRGAPIAEPPVTLIGVETAPGEGVYLPARRARIYPGDYIALVLYAAPERLTLTYTRQDTPAVGYMVHVEGIAVDPAIVVRYQELDAAGRGELPALRNGDLLGWATAGSLAVAVRDTGSFMDPRVRKDWWQEWLSR
jgi:hypothetical protein